jgi:hypothetical protein
VNCLTEQYYHKIIEELARKGGKKEEKKCVSATFCAVSILGTRVVQMLLLFGCFVGDLRL